MVVLGQAFGELEPPYSVPGDHPMDDVRALQHDEVAIHGALGEVRPNGEDLLDLDRAADLLEDLDDEPPARRVAGADPTESIGHGRVQVRAHGWSLATRMRIPEKCALRSPVAERPRPARSAPRRR